MIKKALILSFVLFSFLSGYAQNSGGINGYEDFNYSKDAVKDRRVIKYRYIREANVQWLKRVHRVIDTREKKNKVMNWPKSPFNKFLYNLIMDGQITAYANDSLLRVRTPEDIIESTTEKTPVTIPDGYGGFKDTFVVEQFEASKIVKYRIMEDWIFDYSYSDFRPRIIALAPLYTPSLGGVALDETTMFWVKMDDLREPMTHREVFNPNNQGAMLNYDDFFQMRMFSSYIVKEANYEDMDIKYLEEYKDDPFEALLKSEEIKNDLFIMEHDLWEY